MEAIVTIAHQSSHTNGKEGKHFTFTPRLVKVKELLANTNIKIPHYQRPYKWTLKNVNQLLDDILHHRKHTAYRLGTLVIHREKEREVHHIVDGQQRSITLTLIAYAIFQEREDELKKISKAEHLSTYQPKLASLRFSDKLSQKNIQQNYEEIKRRIREFDSEAIQFFYDKCELVEVVIQNISEAFQFFDSQNARGRDLEPHDLLKAFHLREMAHTATEQEKLESVAAWEAMDTDRLASLFENYLFRIRNWSKGYPARYFTKSDVQIFKGISPEVKEKYPFADLYRIGHYYVKAYNQDYHRQIDRGQMPYPFQLDGVLMNGKRFFEMVGYYQQLLEKVKSLKTELKQGNNSLAKSILEKLDAYPGHDRTGDKYVRTLFDDCLLYYLDKFGVQEIDRAIEKFFIWSYSLRLQQHSVKLASMDNHALGEVPLLHQAPFFKLMQEALRPADIFNIPLPEVKELKGTKVEGIQKLFKQLHYLP